MKLLTVFGTRPEWIKLAPVFTEIEARHHQNVLLHTGQHYSPVLDREIRDSLEMKKPKYQLKMGSGAFGEQLAMVLPTIEKIIWKEKPDFVLVQGDTNSALAGALVAARNCIPLVHIEAGCRSGNKHSPEEQNRKLIDSISTIHFSADSEALANLLKEGVKGAKLVGNTGIDAVLHSSKRASLNHLQKLKLQPEAYAVATIHRAENTDSKQKLFARLEIVEEIGKYLPVLLAAHPRLMNALKIHRIKISENIRVVSPFAYLEFISLLKYCRLVASDSGGIQEEAAILRRPCLILREETEWMRLVEAGRNFLCPTATKNTKKLIEKLCLEDKFYLSTTRKKVELLSGASARIVRFLEKY